MEGRIESRVKIKRIYKEGGKVNICIAERERENERQTSERKGVNNVRIEKHGSNIE